jgi:hypothetical protein
MGLTSRRDGREFNTKERRIAARRRVIDMPRTRFANSRVTPAIVWPILTICALSVVTVVACARTKSEGYRRVEFFSAGYSKIEFRCQIGVYQHDTIVATTPWTLELDLDTLPGSWDDRCRVTRTNPGPDKLWVWAFDRESLRMAKYLATQFDTVDIDLGSWICYRGRP